MARILVTGGCGFIGSHLCAALLARGDAVRVLDDLSTGMEANLAAGADLIQGDIADAAAVRQAVAGIDACFHLAAIASVERGVRDWVGAHRTNLSATIGLFDALRGHGVPVVYASSAAVYGAGGVAPRREDAALRPLSAYGADKLGCEHHALVAGLTHGIPTVGLRFFNVFGPRQDPASAYSGVISIFCDRLRLGHPLTIFGDGEQTRDFVHVGDVVRALLAALRRAAPDGRVFNVCTGRGTSLLHLAAQVASLCDVRLVLHHEGARRGDIRHSIGDPALAQRELGFTATIGLRQGLAETLDWLRAGSPGLAGALVSPGAAK